MSVAFRAFRANTCITKVGLVGFGAKAPNFFNQ